MGFCQFLCYNDNAKITAKGVQNEKDCDFYVADHGDAAYCM